MNSDNPISIICFFASKNHIMIRKFHAETWQLRKYYLANAICHQCRATKLAGHHQYHTLNIFWHIFSTRFYGSFFFMGYEGL